MKYRVTGLLLFSSVVAPISVQASDEVQSIVGTWDLVGSQLSIEIRPDHTVQHSSLGSGDIEHENARYFRIRYRQHHLDCRYDVKIYSETEASFLAVSQPSPQECDLGVLRRVAHGKAEKSGSGSKDKTEKSDNGSQADPLTADAESSIKPLTVFRECAVCPDMVVIPSGTFSMGASPSDPDAEDDEKPSHAVNFAKPFAVGRFSVTHDQFAVFVDQTGHQIGASCSIATNAKWQEASGRTFRSPGFDQKGNQPSVCISWEDAEKYAKWLSSKTGRTYRLLTEAEREYVARAGTTSAYWWGDKIDRRQANFEVQVARDAQPSQPMAGSTVSVDKLQANPWGLFHVHGNVAEWTADCWNPTYVGSPADGSAAMTGDCSRRVLRGGSWAHRAQDLRASYREAASADLRANAVGFRVARDISPTP